MKKIIALTILCFAITSCSGIKTGAPNTNPRHDDLKKDRESGGVFSGKSGIVDLFSTYDDEESSGTTGIGVSSHLWRASLDTISFMPLASADPFGGVIITDWYSPPNTPDERFKVNIFILSKELRSDGVRTSVFRQALDNGIWRDRAVSAETVAGLENSILTRARELKSRGLNN